MTTDLVAPAKEVSDAGLTLLTGPQAGELMTAVLGVRWVQRR